MRRLMIMLSLACLLCVSGPGFAQIKDPPKKPDTTQIQVVAGKTLEQWMKEATSKDASRRSHAIHMILYFGPDRAYEAVPVLLAELQKHSPDYPIDASVRHNLVISLGMILGGVKDQPGTKYVQEATRLFKRLLKDREVMIRYRAAQALGYLGTDAKDSVTELLTLVKDKTTWEVRQAACEALGRVAIDTENGPNTTVIRVLYGAALNDTTSQVRLAALESLTYLGAPTDMKMKGELLKYLDVVANKDLDPMVQMWAHMAVMSIGRNITEDRMVSILQIAVKTDRVDTKVQACQALGTVGTKAKTTAPAIVKMLADRDPSVVYWATWALIHMESQIALPVLDKMSKDPERTNDQKKAAKDAIEQINVKMKKNPKIEKK